MSPLEKDLVRRKLAHLVRTLESLRPLSALSEAEYRTRLIERKAAERMLQEVIEAALDVNAHVLVGIGRGAPADAYSSFVELGDAAVLDADLARRLAPAAGLRNRLVHEYDVLDDSLVYAALQRALDDFGAYVEAVRGWLES